MDSLITVQAIVSAVTLALVLAAVRLTVEIEALEDMLTPGPREETGQSVIEEPHDPGSRLSDRNLLAGRRALSNTDGADRPSTRQSMPVR